MSATRTLTRALAVLFIPCVLAACAGGAENAEDTTQTDPAASAVDTSSSSGASASPATTAGASDADRPITTADIDAYERGLRAEIDRVNQLITDKAQAKTGTDTLTAVMGATPQQTVEIGAKAAGVTVDRYRDIAEVLDRVLGARQMQAMMRSMSTDTANLPAEARARARETLAQADSAGNAAYTGLPSDVAEALKQRAAGLDSLRMQLVGLRLKTAQ